MNGEFPNARKLLVECSEAGEPFDREADEGGCRSQQLQ
jgi:hypothetical protein